MAYSIRPRNPINKNPSISRMQKPLNNPKIPLQKLRSNMLKHPNGNNPIIELLLVPILVIGSRRIAIITKQDTNPSTLRQPSTANPLLSKRLLLLGEGDARHATARRLRGGDGYVAPAAADIEEVVGRLEVEFAEEAVDFAFLGGF